MGNVENIVNMEEALLDWAAKCPALSGERAPLLGYLREYDGACALRPVAGEAATERYIGGARLCSYDFYYELMLSLSITSDRVNSLNMLAGRIWREWLLEMEEKGDYPDFGEGRVCVELKCMSNMPQMAQVYEGGMAKYHFPARILYLELR